ncbi:MAG: hypothetical protein K0U21_08625 [Proteobacteria bacterium]|nr:hypothetical protein [Pseudomonadota bacterium]
MDFLIWYDLNREEVLYVLYGLVVSLGFVLIGTWIAKSKKHTFPFWVGVAWAAISVSYGYLWFP